MDKLSIIIPLYNAQVFIPKLVQALNEQTRKDFVVIFVDDASTDDSVKLLQELSASVDFNMHIHQQAVNGGPGKARNDGMTLVRTPYFTFVDADDWVSTNYVEEFLNIAENTNADIVIGNAYKIWDNGTTKLHWRINLYQKLSNPKDLACIIDYGPWGKMYKTDLWNNQQTSFPTNIRCEDLAAITMLLSSAHSFAFAPSACYYYYQTPVSRSRMRGQFYNDIYESCRILETRLNNPYIAEYQYATTIGYGVIMNAILANQSNKTIRQYINILKTKFPNGYKHPMLKYTHWAKRTFIYFAYLGQIWALRLMVKIAK